MHDTEDCDTYSLKKNSKHHDNLGEIAIVYLGREPIDGDIISVWVHSKIMSKSFLKSFNVKS
jgi:hypothetical protein